MDDEVLYQFEIPYPWKRLLRGLLLLTVGFLVFLIICFGISDYYSGKLFTTFYLIGYIVLVAIGFGIYLIMRYLLIHGDRIKTPIKVTVTLENVYWNKGRANFEFYLTGIKDVKIEIDDKKAMIDVNYKEPVGTSQGWRLKFRRKDEFENDKDYEKFVKETFPKFIKVVKERIKELNPDVVIKEEDRRKRYR